MGNKTEAPFNAGLIIQRTELRLLGEELLKLRVKVAGLERRIEALERREHSHPLGVGSLAKRRQGE